MAALVDKSLFIRAENYRHKVESVLQKPSWSQLKEQTTEYKQANQPAGLVSQLSALETLSKEIKGEMFAKQKGSVKSQSSVETGKSSNETEVQED
jgi:hypothetical protein